MQTLKAGVLYFAVVFGAGFVLGPIRILWAVPRLGTRMAELLEAPIMLVVTLVAARWIVRRLVVPPTLSKRLSMGGLGLGLMLIVEFTLVFWLRGLSIREYLAGRDPVAGTVYYALLGVFAVMPLLVNRTKVFHQQWQLDIAILAPLQIALFALRIETELDEVLCQRRVPTT
jgi:hypothetical protein